MNRFRGSLLGLAVGDAVGTTVEFSPPGSFPPVTDMVGGGPFELPVGAWTDDTSMALCLAESVLETAGFDPVDQLQRYVRWWREGHWSSTGTCFDIGRATRQALQRFRKTGEPFPGDAARDAAGNGPLMKLAPIPMAWAHDLDTAVRFAGDSARTTHGAPEAVDATRHFALLLVEALNGAAKEDVLRRRELPDLHPKVAAVAAGSFLDKAPPEIRGNGYIVLALEAALWAVASTDDYESCVLAAVNLGDDADTTAAIAGQLAGALYGLEGIPARWLERVHLRDELLGFADRLQALRPLPSSTL
ncbi:ADP-ribosylglycohydrolase family protein [Solirubrobacter sp. CPCC 204708]|uniref:ADP-ribosylglycohydrolase family protein n=1 Tax=Solirubrobacter deserti TaxID=2282478 RepID=A0ABT4REZ0_9ACTN|nr:ADP-ribosylglycohydrolase family protein [Solirubrobacter deserti]MBE2318650.1 ADP-ribosylglycohydrolase family protein [Solirubrobacter deserti]MDA0137108.1 ADP-ribosylglycohydrolase family protein [Solirubrobacter deserti]